MFLLAGSVESGGRFPRQFEAIKATDAEKLSCPLHGAREVHVGSADMSSLQRSHQRKRM